MRGRKRWLSLGVVLAVAAIAIGVIATSSGTTSSGTQASERIAVSVVLAHAAIRAGSTDTAVAVNDSRYWLLPGDAGPWPRTAAVFTFPTNVVECIPDYILIPPHSRYRLRWSSICARPFAQLNPGRWWVVFPYQAGTHRPPPTHPFAGFGATQTALAKLTVRRRY